jgi:hypothetical protein
VSARSRISAPVIHPCQGGAKTKAAAKPALASKAMFSADYRSHCVWLVPFSSQDPINALRNRSERISRFRTKAAFEGRGRFLEIPILAVIRPAGNSDLTRRRPQCKNCGMNPMHREAASVQPACIRSKSFRHCWSSSRASSRSAARASADVPLNHAFAIIPGSLRFCTRVCDIESGFRAIA